LSRGKRFIHHPSFAPTKSYVPFLHDRAKADTQDDAKEDAQDESSEEENSF